MTRRRRSPAYLASLAAWLALAMLLGSRAVGSEPAEHGQPPAKAAATPVEAPAPAPAKAAKPEAPAPAAQPAKREASAPSPAAKAPAEAHASAPAAEGSAPAGAAPAADSAPAAPATPLTAAEVQGLLKLGTSLGDRGDYDAAELAYRKLLTSPGVPEEDVKTALLGMGRMYRRKGELTKAVAIYERFLKEYPGDDRAPDALLDCGRTLRTMGATRLAIGRFYSVINSTLKLPGEGFDRYQVLAKTAQFEIAETYFEAGQYTEATKFYTRLQLLELAPVDRARAQFKAAYALRLKGELEAAATTLRAFIDQWPADENVPEARYLLAVALRELKRPQEAFNATLELLRTEKSRVAADPKRWAYWQRRTGNQLANDFFDTGDTLNARAIYASLLDLSTDNAWRLPIQYQLGLCYERLGLADRAHMAYKTIVESAGATPPPELAELVKMAGWRREHLEWRERTRNQVSTLFESSTGKAATALPTSPEATPAPTKAAATP